MRYLFPVLFSFLYLNWNLIYVPSAWWGITIYITFDFSAHIFFCDEQHILDGYLPSLYFIYFVVFLFYWSDVAVHMICIHNITNIELLLQKFHTRLCGKLSSTTTPNTIVPLLLQHNKPHIKISLKSSVEWMNERKPTWLTSLSRVSPFIFVFVFTTNFIE